MSACLDAPSVAQSSWAMPVTPAALKLADTLACVPALSDQPYRMYWLWVRVEPLTQPLPVLPVQRSPPLGIGARQERSRAPQAIFSVPGAASGGSAASGVVRSEASSVPAQACRS